jgi:NifU-like N terminal domain
MTPQARALFRGLPGAGTLPPGPHVCTGEAGEAATGTQVRFHLQVVDGAVIVARFQAYGCPHTLAVCAHLAGAVVGRRTEQGVGSGPEDWAREFEVPTEKLGRLLVVEDAMVAAFRNAAKLPVK